MVLHSIMKSAVLSGSRTLWVRQEWSQAPHLVLILDGIEDMVHRDFEQKEVDFLSVELGRVLWEVVY